MPIPPLSEAAATATTSASGVAKKPDQHKHRRRFIGPMPEKVLFQQTAEMKNPKKRSRIWSARTHELDDEDEVLQDVIREHAYNYFMGHGGKLEDWNEQEDRRVQDEMLKRWKDGEWSKRRKSVTWDSTAAKKWIGSSFNVGVFLGVNLLDETASRSFHNSAAASTSRLQRNTGSAASETFVTAPSHVGDSPEHSGNGSRSISQHLDPNDVRNISGTSLTPDHSPPQDHYSPSATSADSTTALLGPQVSQRSNVVRQPPTTEIQEPPLANIYIRDGMGESEIRKMKAKPFRVHYEETARPEAPVRPSEVLARTGSIVPNTSAAAAQRATAENQTPWGEVIMRGIFASSLK